MPAGFFSSFSKVRHSKESTKTDDVEPEVKAKLTDMETTSSQAPRSSVPAAARYVAVTGKEVLTVLQSAAGIIPIPLLQEAIGVALKIIEVCEEGSAVQTKVKEIQDRVGHLMIVVVENVTKAEEENTEKANLKPKSIEADIRSLLSTLGMIERDFLEISEQKRWVIGLYKELNTNTLEACMNRLSIALEKFKLTNDLRDSNLLQELQKRLARMSNKVNDVSRGIQHVVDKVDNIDNRLEEFHILLAKSKRSATIPSSGSARQQMPLKPEVFFGRDDLVAEIAQMLMKENTSRVCILGPGGMGKTSVSLAVVESPLVEQRFSRKEPVWVPCIAVKSAALLIETLYIQLQIPGDKQPTLDKIISELNHPKDPRLIIFDNFETPWNSSGEQQKLVGDILRRLAHLKHVAMVMTMRGSHPPCDSSIKWQSKNIQPTDEEACRLIFHEIYPASKNDPDVSQLLRSLGHMPFAVTLMANLGKEAHWTSKDLLEAWLECGPDMFSDNPEQSMTRSISLSVDSDLVKQNPNALLLLSVLSLLPAGTTVEHLRWWAPTLKKAYVPAAVSTLSKAALVQNELQGFSSPILFVIPVVQSFMKHQDRIPEEVRFQTHSTCCQYVLEHACRYDLPEFHAKSKAIAAEDTNIHSVLFDSPTELANPSESTMEALIAFCWYRCDTKATIEIVEHTLELARISGVKRYIAIATWCLGKSCHQVAKYRLAYEHLSEAYRLFNALEKEHELEMKTCGYQCGSDRVDAARFVIPREKVVLLAREVEAKCATLGNDLIHGRSLLFLALSLQEAGRRQEALPYAERARDMLAGVGNVCHLANTLQVITRIHYYDGRVSEALQAITESWRLAELSESAFFQAFISIDFGAVLFTLNRDAEAWKQIEIGLMKGAQCGDEHSVVLALDYLGYGYLRKGDYKNALKAYEAASGKWAGTNEIKGKKHCKENLIKLKEKQKKPAAKIGFMRPGLDNDDSLFFPPS